MLILFIKEKSSEKWAKRTGETHLKNSEIVTGIKKKKNPETTRGRKDVRKAIEARFEKLLHKHKNMHKHTQNKVISEKRVCDRYRWQRKVSIQGSGVPWEIEENRGIKRHHSKF